MYNGKNILRNGEKSMRENVGKFFERYAADEALRALTGAAGGCACMT